MSEVVGVDPEVFAALLAFMWFLSRVLQLVSFESLTDDEPLPTQFTRERPLT